MLAVLIYRVACLTRNKLCPPLSSNDHFMHSVRVLYWEAGIGLRPSTSTVCFASLGCAAGHLADLRAAGALWLCFATRASPCTRGYCRNHWGILCTPPGPV